MSLKQSFLLAVKNILASKVRSILTMLGIIIGVAAVIVIVGLGQGMENYMTETFQSMGTNLLTVSVRGRNSTRSVSVDDMYAIVDENPEYFGGMSPSVGFNGSVKVQTETLDTTTVTGVSEDYLTMRGYEMQQGRFLQYVDILSRHKVCVVGSYVAGEWFQGNAIGQTIKLNGNAHTIVGVVAEIGTSEEGGADDAILIPYSTAAKLMGTGTISSYSIAMLSEDHVAESKKIVEDALYKVFGNSDAYNVMSLSELLDTMSSMLGVMVTILAAIAAISLVVGGIGIMNIMLVSVSERTREIGIRKAVGAKRRHIMWQFVIEAGTTSAIGGILGILIGYLLSTLGTQIIAMALDSTMTIAPSTSSVLTAFGISAGIGIFFGYLPARKAARLNPIDALRYE